MRRSNQFGATLIGSLLRGKCLLWVISGPLVLLAFPIAWRLIQDGQYAADQQGEGITGDESVQHLDHLRDLGWIHRAAPAAVHACSNDSLSHVLSFAEHVGVCGRGCSGKAVDGTNGSCFSGRSNPSADNVSPSRAVAVIIPATPHCANPLRSGLGLLPDGIVPIPL